MINLLPDASKKEIRAARANVVLLRYNFILLGVGGFLIVSCLVVFAVLQTTKSFAESSSATNASKASEFASTKKETDEYRANLDVAKRILNNEIDYTDLVFAITDDIPAGVILDGLSLNAKDFGTQTQMTAHAKDYTAATELKHRFETSKVFTNVSFQSITNTSDGSPYPINVTMNVTMNKVIKK